jgi:CRISPR-associated protein Cmr1
VEVISATFHVTTPMFCGGANPHHAELRPPSIKGVLRFWWRACAWSRYQGDLATIRTEEERLFGGPDAGQSLVTIRLHTTGAIRRGVLPAGNGIGYLGYGTTGTNTEPARECLLAPFEFTMELRQRRPLRADQRALLLDAVRALGTCGGLGSRSRRGLGSLSLAALDGGEACRLDTSLVQLRESGRAGPGQLPEYSALSPHSRLLVGQHGATDALVVLNQLGEEYQRFRRANKQNGTASTLARDAQIVLDDRYPGAYPKRVAFGLPVNYGQRKPVVKPAMGDRRASPLFFHIHHCDGKAVAVVSFLPARFLPDPQRVAWKPSGKPERVEELSRQADALYRPVHEFLDLLSRPGGHFKEIGGKS